MAAQNIYEALDESLLDVGVDLRAIGVNELAWRRDDVVLVLSALGDRDWAILGGDVVQSIGGQYEYDGGNWHCEPKPGETRSEFINRSHAESVRYVFKYPSAREGEFLFVLVGGRVL